MKHFNKTVRFIVGLIFLTSSLLKAISVAQFANLLGLYGANWFGFAAPLVIIFEGLLALLLLFDIRPRLTSIATICFTIIVSSVYLYGLLSRGITDCGCFGELTFLNNRPWLTFTRNILIVLLLLPSVIQNAKGNTISYSIIAYMAAIMSIIMFMCGFSFRTANCLKKQKHFTPVAISEHPLSNIIDLSSDSTYLVFVFSYTCPHCQNSIGNVQQYKRLHVVDNVIGIALNDTIGEKRFHRLFDVDFPIINISDKEMIRLAKTMPTAYFTKHDTIIDSTEGMLASPALLFP